MLQTLLMRVIAAARVSVVLRPMPVVGVGYGVLPRLRQVYCKGAYVSAVRAAEPRRV